MAVIDRAPIPAPPGCDMPVVCQSVEYDNVEPPSVETLRALNDPNLHDPQAGDYDEPPLILHGPGGDYKHAETPDVAPLGWPMAIALACGAGLALYAPYTTETLPSGTVVIRIAGPGTASIVQNGVLVVGAVAVCDKFFVTVDEFGLKTWTFWECLMPLGDD